jgi:hypothetical protein
VVSVTQYACALVRNVVVPAEQIDGLIVAVGLDGFLERDEIGVVRTHVVRTHVVRKEVGTELGSLLFLVLARLRSNR